VTSTEHKPPPAAGIRLEHWSVETASARLAELMHVYRRAFLDVHERDPARAERERTAHARTHLARPGLQTVVAIDEAASTAGAGQVSVVGIGYGQPGARGQWWHDVVVSAVTDQHDPETARDWLDDCFEVVELHVLPEYQGRQIGRDVLRSLLAGAGTRTAALSALEPAGSRARRLYEAEGFVPLLSDFRFPGGPTRYAVLAKRLDG
jgi:GNAT superfamily N-acetyltransferase